MLRWIPILIAVAGLSLALYTVATARHEPPKARLEAEPSVNPFASGIAATGLVESASRDVQVASPEGAIEDEFAGAAVGLLEALTHPRV